MGGGPRGRGGAPSAAIASPSSSSLQVEESFSLVRENPLNFGMAIKLAPDLVEEIKRVEIKRVEAQGGTARIKFDVNANNPNGNVLGDHNLEEDTDAETYDISCDEFIWKVIHVGDKIFKFTWSREPGDLCDIYEERQSGEDGNGLLVESGGTWRKLNVERELDESTKNHVKRRAIVLDHQNPSMKNQVKAIAAAESNPWRNFKHRKEPPSKKAKFEPPSGGPPKSAYKSGLSTTNLSKGKFSSGSPLSSQPDQHGCPASPVGSNLVKGLAGIADVAPTQNMNNIASSDKEMHSRLPNSNIRDKSKLNRNTEAKPADLRSLMVSLLLEHESKGMSLKALEKAIGDAMPNSVRQIEPILKQIAIYRAPGRYFLKPGEKESSKKPPSQSGSSPEIIRHQSPAPQKFDQPPAQDPSFSMRTAASGEEQGELNSTPVHIMDTIEKIDILQNSPQQFSDKKVSDNSEGLAGGSSSDSGSDSDSESDSSDSGSDSESHSRSKSRSPVGSSSDSESDASTSSKQASDEDVDIISDDDKESKHKMPDSDPVSSKFPVQWSDPDDENIDIGNYEKQDDHVSDVVEIEKDSPEFDHDAERPAANYSFPNKEREEPVADIRPPSADHHEPQEREVSDRKAYDGPDRVVNDDFKQGQSGIHERFSKGKSKRRHEDKHSDERTHNRKKKSKNSSQPVSGTINSIFGDSPLHSSPDMPLLSGPINLMVDRTTRDDSNDPNLQTGSNQVIPTRAVSDTQQSGQRSFEARVSTEAPSGEKRPEAHIEDGLVTERRPMKFSTESVGDKHATMTESHYRKPEMQGKVKEAGPHSNSNIDLGRGKPPNKITADSGKLSPPNSEAVVSGIPDGPPSKKKAPEHYVDDITRSHYKSIRPLDQHHQSWGDHTESVSQHNKVPEMSNKSRFADTGTGRGPSVEAYGDTSRRMSANSTEQQHDPIRGVGPHTTKESKKQKPNVVGDSNGRRIDASLTDSNNGGQKKKDSSTDENSCLYTKYEKEEPELKGPIKDASQYKEYVKEYQEKYESYCSLNKILESYRDEFSKLGKDLEGYKGSRDMKRYHDTLEQMRSSFRQCGEVLNVFLFPVVSCVDLSEKRRFASAELKPISNVVASFLQIMKYRGYIKDFQVHDPHRVGKITVQLLGRVNDCRAITYRQDIKAQYIENYKTRALPTHQWGYVVITTPNGVLDHEEAIRQNVGGQVLGYFY
ncbi:hypothetical protein DH2020_016304 [Rehmannia glutinosa]|uniref:Small ribosomal subunit protein uS8c n=1 Tax=Rehmannia glutinosa TaxID=99300 RepID=A0ABR0WNR8_REHGL